MGTEWLMDVAWGRSALEGLWRASWQGALFAGGVWALTRALPRMPSALRAGLWWLVSLKFVLSLGLLAPVPLPLLPASVSAPAPVAVRAADPDSDAPIAVVSVASAAQPRVASVRSVSWRQVGVAVVLALWGLGIAWQLRGHLEAWASVRRLRRRALPLRNGDIEEAVLELASLAGLRRVPRLLVSEEVTSPWPRGCSLRWWCCPRGRSGAWRWRRCGWRWRTSWPTSSAGTCGSAGCRPSRRPSSSSTRSCARRPVSMRWPARRPVTPRPCTSPAPSPGTTGSCSSPLESPGRTGPPRRSARPPTFTRCTGG